MRATFLAAILTIATAANATADPSLRMPPGTRTDAAGNRISGRGLRDSTDFLAKELQYPQRLRWTVLTALDEVLRAAAARDNGSR